MDYYLIQMNQKS